MKSLKRHHGFLIVACFILFFGMAISQKVPCGTPDCKASYTFTGPYPATKDYYWTLGPNYNGATLDVVVSPGYMDVKLTFTSTEWVETDIYQDNTFIMTMTGTSWTETLSLKPNNFVRYQIRNSMNATFVNARLLMEVQSFSSSTDTAPSGGNNVVIAQKIPCGTPDCPYSSNFAGPYPASRDYYWNLGPYYNGAILDVIMTPGDMNVKLTFTATQGVDTDIYQGSTLIMTKTGTSWVQTLSLKPRNSIRFQIRNSLNATFTSARLFMEVQSYSLPTDTTIDGSGNMIKAGVNVGSNDGSNSGVLSSGAIAGIAVGAAVVVLIVGATVVYQARQRRRVREQKVQKLASTSSQGEIHTRPQTPQDALEQSPIEIGVPNQEKQDLPQCCSNYPVVA